MITPQLSGWCLFPETLQPERSHERCHRQGAGNRARPSKEFQPCPCGCHYAAEYECGNCGLPLSETTWENEDPEAEDEMVYTHLDPRTGLATGEECR